jgi:uncharacterized protein YkwD
VIRTPALFLRLLMLVSAVLLLVVASAFLIDGRWHSAQPSFAEQPEATPTPHEQFDWSRLAQMDPGRLHSSLVYLSRSLLPAPTPTPAPAPTAAPPAAPPASAPEYTASSPSVQPEPPAQPPASQPSCPTAGMSGFGLDLFNAINSARTSNGLPALAVNGCVVYVAQLRSNDMASQGYFAHTSPSGQTAFGLLDSFAVPYGWAGENLARNNYPDDESVAIAIRDLMASQGHRDNILNPHYTEMGVAVAFDGAGMKYFTMVFTGPA